MSVTSYGRRTCARVSRDEPVFRDEPWFWSSREHSDALYRVGRPLQRDLDSIR